MNISQNGIDFIKKAESCVLKAYQDDAGIWTIDYGCVEHLNGDPVKRRDAITQTLADTMLQKQIDVKIAGIKDLVKSDL